MSETQAPPHYERIWLQPFAGDEGSHTWCHHRVGDDDIEYVRADLARIEALSAQVETLTRERDDLHTGRRAVLPQTREHAENLYTVAVACLKSYGVDPESDLSAAQARIAELERAVDFVVLWAYRETNISDAERLSAIKYHPTIRARLNPTPSREPQP
jgi:hypothetical protein